LDKLAVVRAGPSDFLERVKGLSEERANLLERETVRHRAITGSHHGEKSCSRWKFPTSHLRSPLTANKKCSRGSRGSTSIAKVAGCLGPYSSLLLESLSLDPFPLELLPVLFPLERLAELPLMLPDRPRPDDEEDEERPPRLADLLDFEPLPELR
jgi:hypothetical protein